MHLCIQINGVLNAGASSNTPSREGSDKSLERVSNMAQSGGSIDNMLEKADPIKSAKEPSCENTQVISIYLYFLDNFQGDVV